MTSKRYYPHKSSKVPLLGVLLISVWALVVFSSAPKITTNFEYVCAELERRYENVSCEGIVPPIEVLSEIVQPGFYGMYYHGEPYVFIRADAPANRYIEIARHEIVHYVMYQMGIYQEFTTCEREQVARDISGGSWTDKDKRKSGCLKE